MPKRGGAVRPVIGQLRQLWRNPVSRGYIMLATMQLAYGFSYSAQNNLVTNFFDEVLGFSGPQFGYMTAIREVGGLTLIILMALLYRVSIPWLTAGAMAVMGLAFGFYGVATSFVNIIPWVLIGSFGMHTLLQTQYSLGMSLTTQDRSGRVLGRMTAFYQAGTFVALVVVLFIFRFKLMSYGATFILIAIVAFLGAIAIFRFPNLQDGEVRQVQPRREPVVWRWDYRYYYLLNLLDGVRQQIFFSFGLWVLVSRFKLRVEDISVLLMTVTFVGIVSSSYVGKLIDRFGERKVLQVINFGYVVALAGYALANQVYLVCFFYVLYSFITLFSGIGASTYLRKIAVPEEIAPSLAMGVTILHATAVVVPVVAGVILNYVGYQVPFFIACAAALVMVGVTRRLDPVKQRSKARVALDEARARARAQEAVGLTGSSMGEK